ncbi:alpha/beta hydrolase [Adhaeribacter pallidiroseus]|uniref:Arylformamidase n=1 Tax=Adhaeribacter pallidiroseus TaxID=2072847 RepID=A0A369QQX1_9BACT|nr:alpha/beta hydrolase [Adhaeribacter pallidiroseus]RDC65696.1 Arylformamidase [Adhaeribacter pallidiroseus]
MSTNTHTCYSLLLIVCYLLGNLSGCTFKRIHRTKNIAYTQFQSRVYTKEQQHLNVFAPRRQGKNLKKVLIFMHGGSWNSGKKATYNFLGNRLARKNVVAVIIDYPLSPKANYAQMATAAASAVKWTKENIKNYGGDPHNIFVAGHSAGGHLAALITVRHQYLDSLGLENSIKGTILIDAAGLDMYGYLQEEKLPTGHTYLQTFTANPTEWKEASPLYHLHPSMPPFLIYQGGNTYPSISKSNEKFVKALRAMGLPPQYQVLKGKKHIPMITQFINSRNPRYQEIITFMQTTK